MDALSSAFLTNVIRISPPNFHSQDLYIQSAVSISSRSHKNKGIPPLGCTLENIITTFINPPFRPFLDPKQVLSDNYAPVDELPPTEILTVEGTLPPSLNGAYIRNGPNPQFAPQGAYHLFDGDGMLHCLCISNGHATLCSRYIKTNKFRVERDSGSPVLPNILSALILGLPATLAMGVNYMVRHLCGQYSAMKGVGVVNTSVSYFGDKLFALGESDLPYQIQVTPNGDVETVGRHDFEGKFSPLSNMTSPPKVDSQTGETFAFRYNPVFPFLTYFRFDSSGSKQEDIHVKSLTRLAFIHDFAITKKFAVFTDIQLGVSTNLMDLIGGSSILRVDPKKVPRIGVIPRYATDDSEMRWFDVPGFNNMHALNAWDEEEDNSIILIAPNMMPVKHALERMDLMHLSIEKVRIDLNSGKVTRTTMSNKKLDMGVIYPDFIGRKNRYGYLGTGNQKLSGVLKLEWSLGVVKLDWSSRGREVGCRMFGEGCYGGEPFFVPKGNGKGEEEDDGYLVTYVHDENSGDSSFLVMDAKSTTLDIVAKVKLPQRVPYGFHGLFVKEDDLVKLRL